MQTKAVLSQAVEIPEDIICPITQQIMTDPVMLVESGHTYEREAILAHLKNKQTDPLTNQAITNPAIAPNHIVRKMIGSFLEKQRLTHPDIHHETYLPQSWIDDLLTAMEKADIQRFKDMLKKDNRLLLNPIKESKTIFRLACESGSLAILEILTDQLGNRISQLENVKQDKGFSIFLMVSRRLGIKGATCIAKALDWKPADFQVLLISSVEQNAREMAGIALSLLLNVPTLDITQADQKGNTVLHYAAMQGNQEIVQLLMERGLSIKTQNNDRQTPLELARVNGHHELSKWMEERYRSLKVKRLKSQLKAKEAEIKQLQEALKTAKSTFPQVPIAVPLTTRDFQAPLSSTNSSTSPLVSSLNGFPEVFPHVSSSSTQTTLSYFQQLEAASKAVQDKINPEALKALLKWGVEGHLVEVEKCLKKNPSLGLGTGIIADLSGRTFRNMTVLQYAAWALDAEMCELIIPYLGAHNTLIQLKALSEEPERYSPHGVKYDFIPLVSQYQIYLDNYQSWDIDQCRNHWQKEVSREQQTCPAWLIYAWSESGADVSWTKKDVNRTIKREYDKPHLERWCTQEYKNKEYRVSVSMRDAMGRGSLPSILFLGNEFICYYNLELKLVNIAFRDRDSVLLFAKSRSKIIQRLKGNAESQCTQMAFPSACNQPLSQTEKTVTVSPNRTSFFSANNDTANPTPYFQTATAATLKTTIQATFSPQQKDLQNQLITAWVKGELKLVKKLESQGALLLNTNQTMLKCSQQVQITAKMMQDEIDAAELSALLQCVTEGDLVKVAGLLRNAPLLALGTGTVMDLSRRTFKNVTVLQYAAWALDIQMCELIVDYVGSHNASLQLRALSEEPAYYSDYGVRYDFISLISKTKAHSGSEDRWDNQEEKKAIAKEQQNCPAWLIYAWCEEGRVSGTKVAWTKKDFSQGFEREYKKYHLRRWFSQNHYNSYPPPSWCCVVRGDSGVHPQTNRGGTSGGYLWMQHDVDVLYMLKQLCTKSLKKLKIKIKDQLNEVVLSCMASPTSPSVSSVTPLVSSFASTSNTDPSLPLINRFSGLFNLPPNLKSNQVMTYVEQVEAASQLVQNQIKPNELKKLLKWVTEGHLVEVGKLLKKTPVLGLSVGTVTDRSDRTFKNITALQYAAWALDAPMCELIMHYVDGHNTSIQLNALANEPEYYSPHGASYDFMPLVTKTKIYVGNWATWDENKGSRYWQKEIGGEQRKCPAWLIYAWSEDGTNIAWRKKEMHRPIKREYGKHRLDWWFTSDQGGGKGVGSTWAAGRGSREYIIYGIICWEKEWVMVVLPHDVECVSMLAKICREKIEQLKAHADSQLNQAAPMATTTGSTNITLRPSTPY